MDIDIQTRPLVVLCDGVESWLDTEVAIRFQVVESVDDLVAQITHFGYGDLRAFLVVAVTRRQPVFL